MRFLLSPAMDQRQVCGVSLQNSLSLSLEGFICLPLYPCVIRKNRLLANVKTPKLSCERQWRWGCTPGVGCVSALLHKDRRPCGLK